MVVSILDSKQAKICVGSCFIKQSSCSEEERAGWFKLLCVLHLFLTVPCVGLQCVIVAFPGQTHLLFGEEQTLDYLITKLLSCYHL